jgi:hypothetical protein
VFSQACSGGEKRYPKADHVGKLTVFNIAGNKYQLITAIHRSTT